MKKPRVLRPDDYHCTLDEVGKELGLTRERVRQIQAVALEKLKHGLKAKGYKLEDLL